MTEPANSAHNPSDTVQGSQQVSVTAKEGELSGKRLLAAFWKDDELNDITFKSNDGVLVKANRFVFAAKSDVFRRMLLGQFSESKSPVINLDYEGTVAEALVEYVYTDSAEVLRVSQKRQREEDTEQEHHSTRQIQLLVSLMECGNFYNLLTLCEKALECVAKILKEYPKLSFVLLQSCFQRQGLPKELKLMAEKGVRKDIAGATIGTKDVACLSPSVLEAILKIGNYE
ncbi:meprin and TRAF homology domain-containing protein MATH domain-containing protein [Seminavis robusta]|uniref:Meprin and TRAF homology domain-containing protein MATH domain-containing protein n=1 Tax=Seminavis robusta TaxID=568900 RepID=A0A9N8HQE4_9STRA|nr:meprin and TRAF homology domain-containing protein MATH domain-containing protein [Seminavis robusta]|eukprot:Sro1433_g272280.1 meprin and TRAF homology domain-containing protein MATH domain-containing protein (229) ;mRNA; f:26791-27477